MTYTYRMRHEPQGGGPGSQTLPALRSLRLWKLQRRADHIMVNTNLVSIKINNIPLQVPEGTRILDACRDNGFHVPYLCYLKDINEIGACRVCVVEVKESTILLLPATTRFRKAWRFSQTLPESVKPQDQRGTASFPASHQLSHLCAQFQL